MDNESLKLAWDHDLKQVRHKLVDEAGWGIDDDGDESWSGTPWENLPEELRRPWHP